MVFEGLVSEVLSKVLGQYVKNLNKDQLKIGVFGGNVQLQNLELKEDALANLPINLPISVKKGFLGKLDLKVPWKDLKSKPVVVHIDHIYALAVPETQSYKYDEAEEKKKEQELKKKRLENYEWLKSIREAENTEMSQLKQEGDSFTGRLVTKIIDNLQIIINKVHIRFENKNDIGKLYACGLTLDRLSIQSTDEFWNPSFVDSSQTSIIRKLCIMDSLGFYIDDDADSFQNLSLSEFTREFTNLIPNSSTYSLLNKFILKPVSSQLKLNINKSEFTNKSIPKILVDCVLSKITCTLSSSQYRNILSILNFTNEFLRDMKYLKYRPVVKVSDSPKLWWKYAGQVILDQIREKRYSRSWDFLLQRRRDRIAYVSLFKRSIPKVDWLVSLNKQEVEQMNQLEEKLSFEDIIYFRSLAYAEIKRETEKNKVRKQFLDSKRQERGFFQNLFNTKKSEDEKEAPMVQLSKEERDELYKTIEYNEVVSSVEEPPDWVKVIGNFEIKGFAIELVENDSVFVEALYTGLSLKFEQRNEGIRVQAGIHLFEVYDQFTKRTLFPKIISKSTKTSGAFASAIVDTRPADKKLDLLVELNMDPLNIIITKPLIMKIVDFFHDPNLDITNISNRAGAHIEDYKERAKIQLQDAIDNHKILGLSVNIQAPVIYLPEDVSNDRSNVLIVDLGNFKVQSDNSSLIKGKAVSNTTENDLYDKFNVSLNSIQVLLSDETKSILSNTGDRSLKKQQNIINKFDIQLSIFSSIQQDNLSMTKLKIKGELPRFDFYLSDKKAKQLLCILNAVTADIPGAGKPKSTATTPEITSATSSPSTVSPKLSSSIPPVGSTAGTTPIDLLKTDSKTKENNELLLQSKQIEAEFVIKSISLTLSTGQSDIVRIVFTEIGVGFVQRTFDMSGSFKLSALDIEDCYTKNSLKKLATSNPKDLDRSLNVNHLVMMNFKQIQTSSPEFQKTDMIIDLQIHSFYLVINPATIYQLLLMLKTFESDPELKVSQFIKSNENKQIQAAPSEAHHLPPNAIVKKPATPTPVQHPTPSSDGSTTPTKPTRRIVKRIVTLRQVPRKKDPTEYKSMKFTVTINSLGLALNQETDKMLGIFTINNFQTDVSMFKDNRMLVQGKLGSIVLDDLTPIVSNYKQIITPMNQVDQMLDFKYETFSNLLSNYQGFEACVSANVKSIVLNANVGFLMLLQDYFLGGMLDPILKKEEQKIEAKPIPKSLLPPEDPSKLVTKEEIDREESRKLLVQLQQNQKKHIPKMKLDIVIETPIFVVPQATRSKNSLRMELGKIIIGNTWQDHSVADLPMENMKIHIQDANITIFSDGRSTDFLEKLSVDVIISRFLVPNTSSVEDQNIEVNISHFAFFLDENQYRFFLGMSQNVTKELESSQKEIQELKKVSNMGDPFEMGRITSNDMQYFTEQEVIQKMGKVLLRIHLSLDHVSFKISSIDSGEIAQFIVRSIEIELKNTDKNKTNLQLHMKSILLSDTRTDSTNIFKNLLENKVKTDSVSPFLHVGYIRDNLLGDQYINVAINNTSLFLSPTPLMMISNFFMGPLSEQHDTNNMDHDLDLDLESLQKIQQKVHQQQTQLQQQQSLSPSGLDYPSEAGSEESEKELLRSSTITFNAHINPSITLVEDETLSATRCLMLKTKLNIQFRRDTNGIENAKVIIENTKVNIYKPSITEAEGSSQGSRPIQILKPIEMITIKYIKENLTSTEWKQDIGISCTAVKVFFSYDDVKAILKITNNITSNLQKQQEEQKQRQLSFANMASSSNSLPSLNKSTNSFHTTTTSTSSRVKAKEELYNNNEKLRISCPNISVLFINESQEMYIPIVELFFADIETSAMNWSSDFEAKSSMSIKGDYFNETNMKFEPFIEDWSFSVDFKKNRSGKIKGSFLATRELLNINVSHALLQTISSAMVHVDKIDQLDKSLATSLSGSNGSPKDRNNAMNLSLQGPSVLNKYLPGGGKSENKATFHSHWISNQTGIQLGYQIPKVGSSSFELEANVDPVALPIKISKSRDSTMGDHLYIELKIQDSTIPHLSLDAVGYKIYRIGSSNEFLTCEVRLRPDGSKILIIKSMDQFENNTSLNLELKCTENGSSFKIPKNSKFSLPLLISKDLSRFWVRLENSSFWSEPIDINKLPDSENSKLFKIQTVDKVNMYVSLVHKTIASRNCERFNNTFKFFPPVQIENILPYPFRISIPSTPVDRIKIEPGDKIDFYHYTPGSSVSAVISELEGFPDTKHNLVSGDASSPTFSKTFKLSQNHREISLDIERTEVIKGVRVLSFYCQYWLVNNSLLPIEIKLTDNQALTLKPNLPDASPSPPLLFGANTIRARIPIEGEGPMNKQFCERFPISAVGNANTILLTNAQRTYELSYKVDFCSNEKFRLSKTVTFVPKNVICNELPFPVAVYQYVDERATSFNGNNSGSGSNINKIKLYSEMRLQPGEYRPFHWDVNVDNKKICLRPITNERNPSEWRCSGGFFIDSISDYVVKSRNSEKPDHESILFHVTIKEKHGTHFVKLLLSCKENPPYIIENDTKSKISFYQRDCPENIDYIEPKELLRYGWDDPSSDYIISASIDGKPLKKRINVNKIKGYKFNHEGTFIYVTITIEGPSRVVLFSNSDKKYRSITAWTDNKVVNLSQSLSEYHFYIRCSGIGCSIIDKTPKELTYISMKDFLIIATQSAIENTLEVKLAELQIDNQLIKTDFPVLIHTVSPDKEQRKDFLHAVVIKSTIDNIDYFRYMSTLIQEMTIEIEDHWLKEVLDFIDSIPSFGQPNGNNNNNSRVTNNQQQNNGLGSSFNIGQLQSSTGSNNALVNSSDSSYNNNILQTLYNTVSIEPPKSDASAVKMVYFALLVLNPIKINLTLALQNDGLIKSNHKVLSLVEGLGLSLTRLDRAPITLQGLLMEHPFTSRSTLIDKIKTSYINQALRQFYNILGSVDFLGNPVGLFRNFGTGVHDFFVEPAQGLVKSPADFTKGLAKGTSSFVKNSVYGTFNTLSKLTGTIGTGVATLSFDEQYLQERKLQQARKPKHVGEGLAMGGIGLGRGLFEGITGIITKPVEGAKKGGVGGFAKGLVQGVVGVAVKPATAVIDLTTKTTEGIKNTTNLQSQVDRVRPPRAFAHDNVLRPFEENESEGWFLLKTSHKGKHSADSYIWHHIINSELTIILSDHRIIVSKSKKNFLHSSFLYQIPFHVIKSIKMVPEEGIMIEMDPPQTLGLLDRDVRFKTIGVDDSNINMLLNMKLTHALIKFNESNPHLAKFSH
ncbi:hypothetical protein DICPUDRAFT_94146 [Dictyostelium purpureum]|uniref:Vacuolar protein sorting-associated protein n=1 Tax=Dictyostelium purpureum TaxID=5786 RepID=F0ZG04_DICPU|nr:uncharacterized protein DICPUDRAFT_94146 [Dictyostelium purpureum]EGC37154.1 hypothetical protein DICPUDRAFT_94146 [Dictyostelium purpureum]|eukprot:XP_003286357.1 hypothetical protein DICPUDRAFT_94146 [Dictyostelium purpureum]